MSDSTYVKLRILKSQLSFALPLITFSNVVSDEEGDICVLGFTEVNYGNLPFLKQLRQAGIAYDRDWSDGDNYKAGGISLRFSSDGEAIIKTHYHADRNPPLEELLERLDNHQELRNFIKKHADLVYVEPLNETQVEYGKKHRLLQLVNPDNPAIII